MKASIKRHGLILFGAMVLAVAPGLARAQWQGAPPPTVRVDEVLASDDAGSQWYPGTVISPLDAEIASDVGGRLNDVVSVGTQVDKGDNLARLDTRELELDAKRLQAELERAQAELEFLRGELERQESLVASQSIGERDLARTRADRAAARAGVQSLQAQLERINLDLERASIAAPFAGVVTARLAQPGERISVGSAVVRLVNNEQLEVSLRAPLQALDTVAAGDGLTVRGPSTTTLNVIRLVNVADARSRLIELRLAVPPDARWPVGTPVEVQLPTAGSGAALTVPRDALVLRQDRVFVYVVDEEQNAQAVTVEVLDGLGSRVAVSGELSAGQAVIVRGNERLRPGSQVRVLNAKP